MKLTSAQVERTLGQFEAQAIPDDHPEVPQLNDLFGEHTFFLDSNGLNIVEPAEPARAGAQSAKVVNLASWSDANPTDPGASRPRTDRRRHHAWVDTLIQISGSTIQTSAGHQSRCRLCVSKTSSVFIS
jgi:hypothetical protein